MLIVVKDVTNSSFSLGILWNFPPNLLDSLLIDSQDMKTFRHSMERHLYSYCIFDFVLFFFFAHTLLFTLYFPLFYLISKKKKFLLLSFQLNINPYWVCPPQSMLSTQWLNINIYGLTNWGLVIFNNHFFLSYKSIMCIVLNDLKFNYNFLK